jgi:macrolide transport system ATP-binding/permease protein
MNTVGQNLKFAARQLWRNPGFTVTVIVTLALSIGANTAIFSLVNALVLKSLPYSHPERMGTIYARVTGPGASNERTGIDGEKWELLRDNVPALISAVSGSTSGVNLKAGSRVQYVHDGRISTHYLDVLALQPMIGRNFSAEEDRPHGPRAAILSYSLWRNLFNSNRSILEQPILLKGEPYTVIGVLPEGAMTPSNADIYTALQPSREGEGGGTNFEAIVRLRDSATWQEANTEINQAWSLRAQRFEKNTPGTRITYYSVPLQKAETDTLRPQALALMLAAALILLIACANLAGLTLVRMLRRTSEVATRLALGASRWQIQKQFWIENLLLALVGGAVGIAVGFLALRSLLLLLPEHFLPVASVPLDSRVLAFTLLLSLLTSVLFGMLPALATRKVDLRSSISSRAVAGTGSLRLRQALIAGEIALTVMLLAASGLLIRTLVHLETLAPGFNPNGIMTATASLDDIRFHDPAAFRKLLDESTAAMRQIPGVQSTAVGMTLPYERALNDQVTLSDGKEAGQQDGTDVIYVTPGYFDTLQMPILAGRLFTDADGPIAACCHREPGLRPQVLWRSQPRGPLHQQRHADRRRNSRCLRFLRSVRGRSAHERAGHVHSSHASGCPLPRAGACLGSTGLDCSHGRPDRRIDGRNAARSGQRRSQSAIFRFLQHEGSPGPDACDAEDRSGIAGCNGGSGIAPEHGRHLRAGSQYGRAENPRNRHPYGFRLYH